MQVNKKILRIVYILLVVVISTPVLMLMTGIKSPEKPLHGVVQETQNPDFTFESFNNHKYQFQLSNFLDSRLLFEATLIRLYNQVEFSFFNRIANSNVVLGKNNVLFEPWYISAYYGENFVGEKYIRDQVDKLAAIDSVFKKSDKTLIIALAPGKAIIYPEFIPDYKKREPTNQTNYSVYAKFLIEKKLNVLDFNQWFLDLKPTFERNLFTKGGTHWSEDAALLSLDTLIRFIESKSGDSLNNIVLSEITERENAQGSDNDLVQISNLLIEGSYNDYYYWHYSFEKRFPVDKTLLAISDSFFWNMFSKGLTLTFNDPRFWYYYKTAYRVKLPEKSVQDLDLIEQIQEADYILLMSSPSPIDKFGWGFIDEAYDKFVVNSVNIDELVNTTQSPEDKINQALNESNYELSQIITSIKADPKWYRLITEKAIQRKISIDSMLMIDAIYIQKKQVK